MFLHIGWVRFATCTGIFLVEIFEIQTLYKNSSGAADTWDDISYKMLASGIYNRAAHPLSQQQYPLRKDRILAG